MKEVSPVRIELSFESFAEFHRSMGGRIAPFGALLPWDGSEVEPDAPVVVELRESGELLVLARGYFLGQETRGKAEVAVAFEVIDSPSRAVLDSIAKSRRRLGLATLVPEVEKALEGGRQFEDMPSGDIDSLLEDLLPSEA